MNVTGHHIVKQKYIVTNDLSKLLSTGIDILQQVVPGDIFKVLNYSLESHRMRNKDGMPVRSTPAGRVVMTLVSSGQLPYSRFYEALRSNASVQFTLLSGTLNNSGMLSSYDDCLILDFYVTNISEHYTTKPAKGEQYLTITVECLVRDCQELSLVKN